MTKAIARKAKDGLAIYDPEKGLRTIAVAEAGEKHFRRALRRAKDPLAREQLIKAVETKITAQADYIVWRDGVVVPSQKRGKQKKPDGISVPKSQKADLPDADPGDVKAHRWRKHFCVKDDGGRTIIDCEKIARAKEEAEHRCQRACEFEGKGTERGTAGTGEFERYTPPEYIEAARLVLGGIDLDPATSEQAQRTVRATTYFTEKTDGLKQEWRGRIWLNPPYHRELAPLFIDKLVAEIDAGRVTAAIMLTNNSTDTEWFDAAEKACAAICFTNGRIKFTQPNGTEVLPTQGQAFFYFGPDVKGFASVFCRFGFGVEPSWAFDQECRVDQESRDVDGSSRAVG